MGERWYKEAVIYCVEVDTFQDSDGDGCGDLRGLISRLDYLARLGVTCLWLNPIHPTPHRDDGYDVADYYGVDPRLGTPRRLRRAGARRPRERGIRILLDLVVNHTSDQHPWFQSARADPDSPYRDWYVWSETEPADRRQGIVFPGEQTRDLDLRRAGAGLVLPPLLRLPARPELGEPGGARRDQEGHGLLAAARRRRLPDRRRAVRPRAGRRRASTRRRRTSRSSTTGARTCSGARATPCCCARPTSSRTSCPSTSRGDRRAERPRPHAVRVPAQPAAVAGARARRRRAAGRGAARRCRRCRRWRSGRRSCATTTSST